MRSTKRPLNQMLNAAMRLIQGRDVQAATRAVQQAVRGVVKASAQTAKVAKRQGKVIDVLMRERPARARTPSPSPASSPFSSPHSPFSPSSPSAKPATARKTATEDAGTFETGRQRAEGLGRDYKLFVPSKADATPRPLVVMLHGCTQDPDDFAAGTGMNALAAAQGFFVLYPEQSQGANSSRCWNWFKHNHQARGAGEPAVIAGMVATVMAQHAIDPQRVYVAGLSAGGAMAAILGDAYPDLFAAVGVHSGLPTGAASDAGSAFAAMKSGMTGDGSFASILNPGRVTPAPERLHRAPPTIVFHGDADTTVSPINGDQVLAASLTGPGATASLIDDQLGEAGGRRVTRKTWRDTDGNAQAEHWLVHGAGHAWSGGDKSGSYADPKGPNASREMLRFFLAHPLKSEA